MFKDGTSAAEIKQHVNEIEAQGGVVTEIYDYMLKVRFVCWLDWQGKMLIFVSGLLRRHS